ncbi:MAG: AAA family ATPase [Bacillota bacterium]
MITSINVKNLGPIEELDWANVGKINLIIGANDSGKTFLAKAIYAAVKTLEEFSRGDNPLKLDETLADKLYWTFQAKKLSDLVRKKADRMEFDMRIDKEKFAYSIGARTERKITDVSYTGKQRDSNSVFIPPKEVLSLFSVIKKTRDIDKMFGFDETYLDLVKALEIEPQKGKNLKVFADARKHLDEMLGGKIEYEEGNWQCRKGNEKYQIHVTAEGIKKIAILDRLLGNRYLGKDSIIIIDEPEANLHPQAIVKFLEIVESIAAAGCQVFIVSHSYFVIKKLYLLAKKSNSSIPVVSVTDELVSISDLLEGIPDNPIINTAIALYDEEVELTFDE